jgi:hypothetical protein
MDRRLGAPRTGLDVTENYPGSYSLSTFLKLKKHSLIFVSMDLNITNSIFQRECQEHDEYYPKKKKSKENLFLSNFVISDGVRVSFESARLNTANRGAQKCIRAPSVAILTL